MQKTVNAKIFAIKYKLLKMLTNSLEKDKTEIKSGAKITFNNYCKIQVVDCTRASYSKEDQAKLDEYASKMLISKQVTHYSRIDIDDIPSEVDSKVNEILSTIEDNQDKNIKRVASKTIVKK